MDGFISILMNSLPLLLNISSSWFMVGLIWFIQIVHYPLFNLVGNNEFQVYHNGHSTLITPLVGTVMIIELISSILLVVFPPKNVPLTIPIIGVILIFIIWASTAFLQIPQHNALAKAYELEAHNILVQTNWIRTIAWSMRGFLLLYMLHLFLTQQETTT